MLKKLIAYQKLLLNSTPPIDANAQVSSNILLYSFVIFVMVFMNMLIFSGNTTSLSDFFPVILPVVSLWMINRILYGDRRLFETIPVSRKYIVLNVFLLSIVMVLIIIIGLWFSNLAFAGILFGILYLLFPQSFNQSAPESAVHQIIETTKGDILMVCILIIILFAGVAITFIKRKKLRFISFAGFATIGYGLLFFLKISMPISPNSSKVEFLESFSIMPQGNTILLCVALLAVIICITSVFIGYNFYVTKSNGTK